MRYLQKIIEYGLYLFIFFLPWQTRWIIKAGELNGTYFESKTISLYGTDVILLLVTLLHCYIVIKKSGIKTPPIPNSQFPIPKIWLAIAGLDFFIFVSIFFAPNKLIALEHYLWFLLGVGLFWLIASAEYNKLKLLWSLVAGAILQAGLGIYQFLTQSTFASKWLGMAVHNPSYLGVSVIETFNGERWLRAYGGLDHPNVLGGLLAIAVLLIFNFQFYHLRLRASAEQAIFKQFNNLTIFYFLLFTSLFLSFSRSAWLGLIIGLATALGISLIKKDSPMRNQILKFSIIGVLVFAVLGNIYSDLLSPRLNLNTRLEQKSITERMESVDQAKSLIKNNLFFGVGIGNYTLALAEQNPGQPAWTYQPVHNTPLLILAEIGIFGFIFFVTMLCAICYMLCRSIFKNKNLEDTISLALFVALITMFQLDHFWWSLHFGVLLFWFIFGLAQTEKTKLLENNLIKINL